MDQKYFGQAFGNAGDQIVIPDPIQVGGSVSFTQGWPFNYQRDLATDPAALPIDRSTTNYLFFVITQMIQQYQQHAVPEWISPANNGGTAFAYSKWAMVRYSATVPGVTFETYTSVIDGNTDTPGATANWQVVSEQVATSAQASAGTDNRNIITSLLLAQQTNLRALLAGSSSQVFNVGPAVSTSQAPQFGQLTGVVGTIRNGRMQVAAASATATFTADEIIVESVLGGLQYRLANFNKTVNLATTGINGMDTGTAPVSGYISLYAIYNPTTQTQALLACAQATSNGNIYTGANMPAGYTASALISSWRTTAASLFVVGCQIDRQISIGGAFFVNTNTQQAAYVSVSVSGSVPSNAKTCSGYLLISTSVASGLNASVASDAQGSGGQVVATQNAAISIEGAFNNMLIMTPQTIYYVGTAASGTALLNYYISGYSI